MYKLPNSPINIGMQTIVRDTPKHLVTLIESLRTKLHDEAFRSRHRVRPQDFTRHRQLTFPLLTLFILQQTVKSIQRHLHDFLQDLAASSIFESVTPGAVTHARAKLKDGAFIELNQQCVLPSVYHSESLVQRWRGHRLFGMDSSLVRLPNSEELGKEFGWKEACNQNGSTGTRYPEARLSVAYDLLNRVGLEARLEPSTVGEVSMARQQLAQLEPGDIQINDRGFTGFIYLALILQRSNDFISRCSTGSFLATQHVQAAVLLANLESVLSEPTQTVLDDQSASATHPLKVNRSTSYHALKQQVLDLLY